MKYGVFKRAVLLLCLCAAQVYAKTDKVFTEAVHGSSRLVYVGDVPILHLFGTPREMGESAGFLLKKCLKEMVPKINKEFVRLAMAFSRRGKSFPKKLLARVEKAKAGIPKDRMIEINAMAKAAGLDADELVKTNLIPEILPFVHCSTFFIASSRMSDKKALLGRNLDYPPVNDIHKFGIVVVYHEKGRRPLASFTFPGLVGVITGMNDAGLCGATMDVYRPASPFRPKARPRFMFYRELLSANKNTAGVERALKGVECLSGGNFIVVDAKDKALVLESPGVTWHIRRPEKDMLYATNHFRSKALFQGSKCRRYKILAKQDKKYPVFSLKQGRRLLRLAIQPIINIQALLFRPSTQDVYFSFGKIPASAGPFRLIGKKELFQVEFGSGKPAKNGEKR